MAAALPNPILGTPSAPLVVDEGPEIPPPEGPTGRSSQIVAVWRVLRSNPLTLAGAIMVAVIVLWALVVVLVPVLSTLLLGHTVSTLPYPPNQQDLATRFAPPSWQHYLGTDDLGRDMYSRTVTALPLDLGIALLITLSAVLIGGGLGAISALWDRTPFERGVSTFILRATDVFLAFPSLILALILFAVLLHALGIILTVVLAVMLTWWPYYVRLVRGEILIVRNLPYVTAARVAGTGETRIFFRHILRNILDPLVVYFTLDIGTVLITFSTIAFVAAGFPQSIPEWGNMVSYYQNFFTTAPWTVLAPGGAILITVLAFSLLGDGIRDILDPRSLRLAAR